MDWSAIGVDRNVSAEAINNEWQQQVFKQMASGHFFEIQY